MENLKVISSLVIPKKAKLFLKTLKYLKNNKNEITNIKRDILLLKILEYHTILGNKQFEDEVNYLRSIGTIETFPYKKTNREVPEIVTGYDKHKKLPFALHNQKKLYFPKHLTEKEVRQKYLNVFAFEDIFGIGFREKCPHQYLTETFNVKTGDIVLDVGSAEGLFMLHVIDKVKKGFLIESNQIWINPLKATFEPYQDKVSIINKYASNKITKKEQTIDYLIKDLNGNIFIKMDIEGSELQALNGSKSILKRKADIRLACCTYHRHEDQYLLEKFFKELNYDTEFSDGFMLFSAYDSIKPPYFRKGLIRANKNNLN